MSTAGLARLCETHRVIAARFHGGPSRKHTQHIDTVLYYRQKYLAQTGRPETIEKLLEAARDVGEINEEAVRAKIEAEKERERQRGGGKGGA